MFGSLMEGLLDLKYGDGSQWRYFAPLRMTIGRGLLLLKSGRRIPQVRRGCACSILHRENSSLREGRRGPRNTRGRCSRGAPGRGPPVSVSPNDAKGWKRGFRAPPGLRRRPFLRDGRQAEGEESAGEAPRRGRR